MVEIQQKIFHRLMSEGQWHNKTVTVGSGCDGAWVMSRRVCGVCVEVCLLLGFRGSGP